MHVVLCVDCFTTRARCLSFKTHLEPPTTSYTTFGCKCTYLRRQKTERKHTKVCMTNTPPRPRHLHGDAWSSSFAVSLPRCSVHSTFHESEGNFSRLPRTHHQPACRNRLAERRNRELLSTTCRGKTPSGGAPRRNRRHLTPSPCPWQC